MSQYKETIDADLTGRVMYLEQRTKGLQGRISALEVRLSDPACNGSFPGQAVNIDTEFVPAPGHINHAREHGALDSEQLGPEHPTKFGSRHIRGPPVAMRLVDTTGLVAGAILIGVGFLLYAGNIDIIKNPLLSLGCGILLILFSVLRSLLL